MIVTMAHLELDQRLLSLMDAAQQYGASDIHIKADNAPKLRIKGELQPVGVPPLTGDDTEDIARTTMREPEWTEFLNTWEKDYSLTSAQGVRFRVNAFYTRGNISMVLRRIETNPPSMDDLGLGENIKRLAREKNGLILVCGATGSGKSTTLASIINHINRSENAHIVTIEDPIEFIHDDIKASISQREINSDTRDFNAALRSSLRQDPDIILLGEMRGEDAVRAALTAAETGHLVLSTLHTTSAPEAITRLLDIFPHEEQNQIRITLATSLRGVIAQRLLPSADGSGRVAVREVLLNQGRAPEAILKPEKYSLEDIMREGKSYGMQSFEDHLMELVVTGSITKEIAIESAVNKHDLRVKMRHLGS